MAFFRDEYIHFWFTKVIQGVHWFVYILVTMVTIRYELGFGCSLGDYSLVGVDIGLMLLLNFLYLDKKKKLTTMYII